MAIIGMHALMYSKDAEETRRFLGEALGFPTVDAGGGWLIFAAPPAELAVHPTEGSEHHELFLMCDDVDATIHELREKGVETDPIQEEPWGRVTRISLPGGAKLGLYEPLHPTALDE